MEYETCHMKILNFGSLNIDHVYHIDHFVKPGETIACSSYTRFSGGKGLNQSIALARAGADVYHGGKIGTDGLFLKEQLEKCGVDTRFVHHGSTPTGHAVIQVSNDGENSIIIAGGANRCITTREIEDTVCTFAKGDYLLVQNEISGVDNIISKSSEMGLKIVFNPAPFTPAISNYPLDLVDIFILNETEAAAITGQTNQHDNIRQMKKQFPNAEVIFTMGAKGALFVKGNIEHVVAAKQVTAVDTTGAGDTFIGFFLASHMRSSDISEALAIATAAAAISVTRNGAADSIPSLDEAKAFINTH
jgi:ribokinase